MSLSYDYHSIWMIETSNIKEVNGNKHALRNEGKKKLFCMSTAEKMGKDTI